MQKLIPLIFALTFSIISLQIAAQGTETFTNIPATSSSYATRSWTGDNPALTWGATDARTDQAMNGKAIVIRNGSVTCNNIPNGIGSISFNHQQFFTGANSVLQVYINNILAGTANPSLTLATTVINNINVTGAFSLEIRQVTAGLRIGIDDISWTSNSAAVCTEPAAQPGALVLTATPTTVSGSFTAPVPPADEYLVVRHSSATLLASPSDGTSYSPGSSLGGGTVISVGSTTTFTTAGLNPATTYYFFVFAISSEDCSGGPNYLTTTPLASNTSTLPLPACSTPPAMPTSLVLTPTNSSVSGSFTAVAGANRYLVVSSTVSTLSTTPLTGTTYSPGQALGGGTIVSYSTSSGFSSFGLTAGTQYYFFVFAANGDCSGEPFYTATSLTGNTTTLSGNGIPPNYYDATSGLTCAPLKTALYSIISANSIELTYTPGVWNAYQTTDLHRNDANTATIIWDMYSDNPTGAESYTYTLGTNQCGNYNSEGDCYNREHSFPKSWFNDQTPMYSDLHHLFPTDGYVNNKRGNFPYGEVSSPTWTSTNGSKLGPNSFPGFAGTVFEPINEYKGDFARAQLYMVTRYENLVAGWITNGNANDLLSGNQYPALDNWDIQLMYKWHLQDPVSQKERDRNNAVYALQHNRNPFVDHPEYVAMVWQCTGVLPVTLIDFKAVKINTGIRITWVTAKETHFKNYEIERSADGTLFNKIAVIAGKNQPNYSFTDRNLPNSKWVFYRLKMIDLDGKFSYSKIVSVRLSNNLSNALVYPNPTADSFTIQLKNPLAAKSSLLITDLAGRTLSTQHLPAAQNSIPVNVRQLPAGRYFLTISNDHEFIKESFVITL